MMLRTVIRIAEDWPDDGADVQAIVTAWSVREVVSIPLAAVPGELRRYLKAGARFLADVNTDAERAADLRFANIQLAPAPRGALAKLRSR
jgi:hypothetical protein